MEILYVDLGTFCINMGVQSVVNFQLKRRKDIPQNNLFRKRIRFTKIIMIIQK